MEYMEISDPYSHTKLLVKDDVERYRLSPSIRVIIRDNDIIIIDNSNEKVYSLKKCEAFIDFFKEISRGSISNSRASLILEKALNEEAIKMFLEELMMEGIIW